MINKNNISKFNMLMFNLWSFYIFLDKDYKMYTYYAFTHEKCMIDLNINI
jgi:hypothetical protein